MSTGSIKCEVCGITFARSFEVVTAHKICDACHRKCVESRKETHDPYPFWMNPFPIDHTPAPDFSSPSASPNPASDIGGDFSSTGADA